MDISPLMTGPKCSIFCNYVSMEKMIMNMNIVFQISIYIAHTICRTF